MEIRDGDTWLSVSEEFGDWLKERGIAAGFGWSEGDILIINEGTSFFCFNFPDRHGEIINSFETWAQGTDRLYGIKLDRTVVFPSNAKRNIALPPEKGIEVPSWLK